MKLQRGFWALNRLIGRDVEDESVVLELLTNKMRQPLKKFNGIGDVHDIVAIAPWDAAGKGKF